MAFGIKQKSRADGSRDDFASSPPPLTEQATTAQSGTTKLGQRKLIRRAPEAKHHGWFSSAPPSVLLTEAEKLRDERDWRKACRVLEAANATAVDVRDRRRVLELTATAAAEASRHRISSNAVYELSQLEPRTASTWIAIAEVALARTNYSHADTAAREALNLEPDNRDAHIILAASFAGLGWFDQAASCLDHVDRSTLTERHLCHIGEAVNRWATTKTMAFPLTLIAALVAGVVALSVGLSVPIITRHLRLRRLAQASANPNDLFIQAATRRWAARNKSRVLTAIGIALPIVLYVGLLFTAA